MEQLQIIFFFMNGFLTSRAMIKARLPQKLVRLLMGQSHNSLSLTVLYLIGTAVLMSFFIPNAITLLTLLPVLELLSRAFRENDDHRIPTLLTLAVLYGANIGGMGSVTGTPSNLLFVGYLKAHQVPGVEEINFLSWLLWGVPLVIVLALLAWVLLSLAFHTWHADAQRVHLPFAPEETEHPLQHHALGIALFYVLSSITLSFLTTTFPAGQVIFLVATGIVTLGLIWYLFLHPATAARIRVPFLALRDTYSGLPTKGLELLVLVLALGGVLYALDAQEWLAHQAETLIPTAMSSFVLLLTVALITSFATEVFSNTVVQLALFLVLLPLTTNAGLPAAQVLLVVTLSSTCAFMSPVATPVNALAFGGMPGMSLWRFLIIGAVMNMLAALLITTYVMTFVNLGVGG